MAKNNVKAIVSLKNYSRRGDDDEETRAFNFVERTRNIDIFFYIYDFSVCVIYNKKKKSRIKLR